MSAMVLGKAASSKGKWTYKHGDKVPALNWGICEDHIALSRSWFVKPLLETSDTIKQRLVSLGSAHIASLILCLLPEKSCQCPVQYHLFGTQQVSLWSWGAPSPCSSSKSSEVSSCENIHPFQDWAWGHVLEQNRPIGKKKKKKVGEAVRTVFHRDLFNQCWQKYTSVWVWILTDTVQLEFSLVFCCLTRHSLFIVVLHSNSQLSRAIPPELVLVVETAVP